jgi:hypothetical protein
MIPGDWPIPPNTQIPASPFGWARCKPGFKPWKSSEGETLRRKQQANKLQLFLEPLEDRFVPSYLGLNYGRLTIATGDSNITVPGVNRTNVWYNPANSSQDWLNVLSPNPVQLINMPSLADLVALMDRFPDWSFNSSIPTLADNSLQKKDLQATGVGMNNRIAGLPGNFTLGVGADIALQYTVPDPNNTAPWHWIQFWSDNGVNYNLDVQPNCPLPFYDTQGTANSNLQGGRRVGTMEFFDIPNRNPVNQDFSWSADLFLVQSTGLRTITFWQGVSWGWYNFQWPDESTTTSLGFFPNAATFGDTVTLTATVSPNNQSGTPTGTVDFIDQNTNTILGTESLQLINGSDQAVLTTSGLGFGTHSIVAEYSGDQVFQGSSVSLGQVTIGQATPTIIVSDAGGIFNGSVFAGTATVAGVRAGVDNTPAPSLEGVIPTLTYYAGTSGSGTALGGAPSQPGTYTVVAYFTGSTDYTSASVSATFTIYPPPPPVAQKDYAATAQNVPVTINILSNDYDPNGYSFWLIAVSQPSHGYVVINADQTITYTPTNGFFGIDTFQYWVSDGFGGLSSATVTVTVN